MTQQYQQNVDNSVWVGRPSLVPGLRGQAYRIGAYPDYLTEPGLGGIQEINHGFPMMYTARRVPSFTPAQQVTNLYVNGKFVNPKSYRFRARRIEELSTSVCV